MDNLEKDVNSTLKFEDLNTAKQIEQLESAFNEVTKKLYFEHYGKISSGHLEIVDLTFNRHKDGSIVYTAILQDNEGNTYNEYFSEDFKRLDITEAQIKAFKLLNFDTTEMEEENAYLESLGKDPNKVSLSELKSLDKEIVKTCQDLQISKERLSYVAVIDNDNELRIKPNEISGIHSDLMDSNQKVSTHYYLKDVIGMNFKSYQVVQTMSGSPILLGIDENGFAKEIDTSKVEVLNDLNTMTLMQENGTTKEASVLAAFRIKSQSDVDRDQVIGLCNDGTSQMTGFYARGAITANKVIGENIPVRVYSEDRVRQEKIMDTLENKDISGEATSMEERTSNGNIADTSSLGVPEDDKDFNELVEHYSNVYGVEAKVLEEESRDALNDADTLDMTDEEVVEETAIDLSKEQDNQGEHENDDGRENDEQGEKVPGRGTPWGNPDAH